MSSRNRVEVPEAKEAMNRFKMEVANELGVPLTDGYNGNLTSAQNGSVGGGMVRLTKKAFIYAASTTQKIIFTPNLHQFFINEIEHCII